MFVKYAEELYKELSRTYNVKWHIEYVKLRDKKYRIGTGKYCGNYPVNLDFERKYPIAALLSETGSYDLSWYYLIPAPYSSPREEPEFYHHYQEGRFSVLIDNYPDNFIITGTKMLYVGDIDRIVDVVEMEMKKIYSSPGKEVVFDKDGFRKRLEAPIRINNAVEESAKILSICALWNIPYACDIVFWCQAEETLLHVKVKVTSMYCTPPNVILCNSLFKQEIVKKVYKEKAALGVL